MSKTVLIGVGGSGQHVVHAYLRLLALTNVDSNIIPEVYIVDADDSELSKQIASLHTLLTGAQSNGNDKKLGNVIRPYFQQNENDTPDNASASLNINQTGILESAFLMDDDLGIEVKEGMFANARIGASVFRVKNINTSDDSAKNVNFKTLFASIASARVAIVGSSFGGTGSGVVPALVREFENIKKTNHLKSPKIVRAFMTLPWFEIEDNFGVALGEKSAARTDADLNPMQRNAMLGLRTYLKELEAGLEITNYVVSQFITDAKTPTRLDKGNFKQPENKHIYNIILANAIQHFLQETGAVFKDGNNAHLLSLLMQEKEKETGIFDAISSHHLRLRIAKDDNRCLQEIFMDANLVALALEKASEGITKGFKSDNQKLVITGADDTYSVPTQLVELIKKIDMNMLEEDSSVFSLAASKIGIESKKRIKKEAFAALAKSISQISKRLRESILWLYAHKEAIKFTPSNVELLFLENNESISEATLNARWESYKLTQLTRRKDGVVISSDKKPNPPQKKTTQAFFLFENIFFDGKEKSCQGYKPKFDLSDENKKRYNNKVGYELAAELIAEQLFKEVRAARQKESVCKTDVEDEGNPEQLKNKELVKMLKGFDKQTSSEAINLRLCKLTQLKEDIKADFKMLDPYLGISKVDVLLKGSVFPETALKGIPNIIAPRLLQEWRLEQCDLIKIKDRPEKRQALKSQSLTAKPESTEYGIFLHARNVIEAAFWLIFTKDKTIELETIESKHTDFYQLLKSEFEAFEESLPQLFILDKSSSQPVFIANKHLGWYLAANKNARQLLTRLIPKLPSVKYGNDFLCELWRSNPSKPKISLYDYKVISAFATYLSDIESKLSGQNAPLLIKALQSLTEDLGKITQELTDVTGSALQLAPVEGKVKEIELAGTKIEFKELSLLGKLQDVFVKKPIYANAKSMEQRLWPLHGHAWQYIDIKKTLQDDNEDSFSLKNIKPSDEDNRGQWLWQKLKIHFKDIGEQIYEKPFGDVLTPEISLEKDNFMWSVALWPNFQAKKWSYYLATADSYRLQNDQIKALFDGNTLKGDCLEFVFWGEFYTATGEPATLDDTGKKLVAKEANTLPNFGKLGVVKNNAPIKLLTGIPRAIEVWFGNQLLGSMPIKLGDGNNLSDSPRECRLALDFGTSNTSIAVQIKPEGQDTKIDDLPLLGGECSTSTLFRLEEDLTWSAGHKNRGKYSHQYLPTFFFQSFNKKNSGDSRVRSIPSELLFVSGVNHSEVRKGIKAFIAQATISEAYYKFSPIKQFGSVTQLSGEPVVAPLWTPFPPSVDDDLKKALMGVVDKDYVQGFKWPQANLEYAYRAAYLESILIAAFATLRRAGYYNITLNKEQDNIFPFIATYPGAFSAEQKVSFIKDLDLIVDQLKAECGMTIAKEVQNPSYKNAQGDELKPEKSHIKLRSETFAALSGCRRERSDISLTVDMGGGTTDIGLIIPTLESSNVPPDSYMSSLRYAGNHLLEALVEYDQKGGNAHKNDLLLALKIAIRDGNVKQDKDKSSHYKLVTEAFFRGLFEYVLNLVAAFGDKLHKRDINIYFLGNGFKLAKLFTGRDIQDIFNYVCLKEAKENDLWQGIDPQFNFDKFSVVKNRDLKQLLIHGALEGTTDAGTDYQKLEEKGHGELPIWLPCIKNRQTNTLYSKPTLGDIAQSKQGELSSSYSDRRKAFSLTSRYWDDENWCTEESIGKDFVFGGVNSQDVASDFGKFYLEVNFVKEVLCKLTKEPKRKEKEQQDSSSRPASSTNTPPQQSGFKPSAVSESMAAQNIERPIKMSIGGAKENIGANEIVIKPSWLGSRCELDVVAYVADGQQTSTERAVFSGQISYRNATVTYDGSGNNQSLRVNLKGLSQSEKLTIYGYLDKSADFSRPCVDILDARTQSHLLSFDPDFSQNCGDKSLIIFGEVYWGRKNAASDKQWIFKARGEFYAKGLEQIIKETGLPFE